MFCALHLSLCRLLPKHDVMFPRRMWGWQVQHWFMDEVTETCGDKKHPPLSPLRSVLKTYDSTNFSYQFSSKMSSKWYRNDCFCHSCDSWGRPDVCWLKIMSLKRYISRNGNTKLNREKMDPGNQIKGKSFLKQKKHGSYDKWTKRVNWEMPWPKRDALCLFSFEDCLIATFPTLTTLTHVHPPCFKVKPSSW